MLSTKFESLTRLENISLLYLQFFILWNSLSLTSSFCPLLCTCNDNKLSVDCHESSNLKMIPIFLNPQTKYLSLGNNKIEDITMSFQFYSELQYLDFSQNKLIRIGQNNFENLKVLQILNASFNSINELESDVFIGLTHTIILDLSANHLEKIHLNAFHGMLNLKELYLDRNRLDYLNWNLFYGLDNLQTLSAKYNFIRVLQPSPQSPPAFTATTTTTSSIPISASSPSSWTLKNVQKLDMSWNQITRIKDHGLSIFSGLLDLNLCCNYIHTVEERAFVPYPSGFLTKVNLSQNRLSRIPTDSLEKLGSTLQELDLSSNRISDTILSHSFRSLFQLRILHLGDNPSITSIDPDALIDNINLVEFRADHLSNLTELQIGLFNNKPFLKIFSLRFAQVSIIPKELFQNTQYNGLISTLRLLGNPIDCNCSSLQLLQYIINQQHHLPTTTTTTVISPSTQILPLPPPFHGENYTFFQHQHLLPEETSLGYIQCASPPNLHGALLQDLKLSNFEHCFERVHFASEHFEILVIGIGSLIVITIITVIGIKLCCVHGLCHQYKKKICCCCCCCCKNNNKNSEDEKDKGLDDNFCCSNGNNTRNGTLTNNSREYPTIVASKKILNINSDDFRIPIGRGRNTNISLNGFGTIYSNNGNNSTHTNCHSGIVGGSSSNSNSHSHHSNNSHNNTTSHSSPVPMTLTSSSSINGGSSSPTPLDLDGYLHLHSTPSPAMNKSNNKLRFDPKMQMQMHLMESNNGGKNGMRLQQQQHHPPMILHYEYDYPDYRSMHRVKQVPSVLV